MINELETLQYPIGRFIRPDDINPAQVQAAISALSEFPDKIKRAVENLDEQQLDTPYRPGGWTIRQVAHHCADSHMNAYIRFKWALTEDSPTIKAYHQDLWAMLPDSLTLSPQVSLPVILGIHTRWVEIMRGMTKENWERSFIHPDHPQPQILKQVVKMYEWHCSHHLAHITALVERMNW